jgi:predicted transcriptional regulator
MRTHPPSNDPVDGSQSENRSEREMTLEAIREGIADVRAGRTKPARESIERLAKKYGIPLPRR